MGVINSGMNRTIDEQIGQGETRSATGSVPAYLLTRGVCRYLRDLGFSPLTEFRVGDRRRVDVMGLDRAGRFTVVEVKSSVQDFQTDHKWPEYLPHGDKFYFAVGHDFPIEILPDDCGILIADAYGAAVHRPATESTLHASRRKAQTLRFAKAAADRLHRANDPSR